MKKFILFLIKIYQVVFSHLKVIFPMHLECPYTPSCSEYFKESVEKFGILRGSCAGFKRISRCHPFSRGGADFMPGK